MSSIQHFNFQVETIKESKAKALKVFHLDSIYYQDKFLISFKFRNISNSTSPQGHFYWLIHWASGQAVSNDFDIPSLRSGENWVSTQYETDALAEGYGLIYVAYSSPRGTVFQFYFGNKIVSPIYPKYSGISIASIKAKKKEELYEFWGMMIAAIGLLIVALEKIISFLYYLLV